MRLWQKKCYQWKVGKGQFIAISSNFHSLFPLPKNIIKVAKNFQFTEGPLWLAEKGLLLFSDIPANIIYSYCPKTKEHKIFRTPSGHSNGLTSDPQGRLVICEHGYRRLTRIESDGKQSILVDHYKEKKLNSPNDVAITTQGKIYFTDPPYGIRPEDQELDFQGVFCYDPQTKNTSLICDDFERPNGLVFSPDEKHLYISDSSKRQHVRIFDVQKDGTLSNGKVFCEMKNKTPGAADGLKVDSLGHLFCTGPGGIWVFDSHGTLLGRIVTPEITTNVAWGDDDLCSLYITTETSLYKIRVIHPGITIPKKLPSVI